MHHVNNYSAVGFFFGSKINRVREEGRADLKFASFRLFRLYLFTVFISGFVLISASYGTRESEHSRGQKAESLFFSVYIYLKYK